MSTVNYNIRIDKELRDQAFSVLESYGLPPSQAFKLFLKQIAGTGTIPLSFDWDKKPNVTTQKAMLEALNRTDFSANAATPEEALQALQKMADA